MRNKAGDLECAQENAALRLGIAAPRDRSNDFGPWFAAQAGRLSRDFTLDF